MLSSSGSLPCSASVLENAIAKQLAWAAAISSSGLVLPSGRSVREAHVTGISWIASLLTRSKVPDPLKRLPLHTTFARRSAVAILASHTSVFSNTRRVYPLTQRSNLPQTLPSRPGEPECRRGFASVPPGISLAHAPFAGGGFLQLAPVNLLRFRLTDLDIPAAYDLSEQGSCLAEGCLHVEVVEAGDAVFGNYDVEPPHGGAGRRIEDADVCDRAADDQRVDAPLAQHVLQLRAVEGVVTRLTDGCLIIAWGKLVHHLPAPTPLAAMLAPDLPLRIAVAVGILGKDDLHA